MPIPKIYFFLFVPPESLSSTQFPLLCGPVFAGIAPLGFADLIPFTLTDCFLSFLFIFFKLPLFLDYLISLKPRKQNPLNPAESNLWAY